MDEEKQKIIDEALHSEDGIKAIAKACGEAEAKVNGEVAGKIREINAYYALKMNWMYDDWLKQMK